MGDASRFEVVMDAVEMVLEDHIDQIAPPYDDDVSEGAQESMRETAESLSDALDTIRNLRDSRGTFEVYQDQHIADWRWRLVHDNGNLIAYSGKGYASKQKAQQGILSVVTNAPGADVVDKTEEGDGGG